MSIELKEAAEKALITLESATSFMSRKARDQHESVVAELRTAIQQAEAQPPATPEPVEDSIRNAEDELNCAEDVLDAITCEFSDGEFPVTDFNCIGDYITAVVDVFKERLAAQQPVTPEPEWETSPKDGEQWETSPKQATPEPVEWLTEMLADTREVFDANGSETPQVVRDVIEYVASLVTVYSEKNHHALRQGEINAKIRQ